jgi:hypothetical protein
MTKNINVRNLLTFAAAAVVFAGCAGAESAADESEGWITEAQTWGGPGIPVPDKMVKDDNDYVETFASEEGECSTLETLNARCIAAGGAPYSVSRRRNIGSEECPIETRIGCLFKIAND